MIKEMTRDEALKWLQDRVGKNVKVVLSVDRGGWSICPITLDGFLKHHGGVLTDEHRDELAGNYSVDDGGLDLSEIPDDAFSLRRQGTQFEELRVSVGEHAGIGITSRL